MKNYAKIVLSEPQELFPEHKNPSLPKSFRHAWLGICHAFTNERNFRVHTVFAIMAATFCILFRLEALYSFMVMYAVFFVLCMELVNTAVETVIDLICGQKDHPLAKIAKDCCAGAVLLASLQAILVAAIVLQHLLTR